MYVQEKKITLSEHRSYSRLEDQRSSPLKLKLVNKRHCIIYILTEVLIACTTVIRLKK